MSGELRKQVHVPEAGRTARQHVGDRELRAVADIFGIDPTLFERPNLRLQPPFERGAFGGTAQQGHCRVRVRIDEARQKHVIRALDDRGGAHRTSELFRGAYGGDSAALYRHGMLLQHAPDGLDRNYPAGTDERVDGVHASGRFEEAQVYPRTGRTTAQTIRLSTSMC